MRRGWRHWVRLCLRLRTPPARHEDMENFYAHLEQSLLASGFLNPANPRRLLPALRRLFGRAGLEQEEVNILRGVLKSFDKNT